MVRTESPAARRQLNALGSTLEASAQRIEALDNETLDCQIGIARIPAPTGHEQTRAAVVLKALRALQCESTIDAAGNVVANISAHAATADQAPVVCMAHLDTVFEAGTSLEVRHEGARVLCPGIGDNGRGLAAMLTIARVLRELAFQRGTLHRPVEFVATVGEEGLGNLRGAHAYFSDRSLAGKRPPHAVLVLDGPGDQHIVHHALGSRRYRITFRGAGGHSWADFGAPNAVHAASRAASLLAQLPSELSGRVAVTVSGIGGGESMNAIPASAWLDVDVRGTEQVLLARADAELRAIVQAATRAELSQASLVLNTRHNDQAGRNQLDSAIAAFHYDIVLIGERPCGSLAREHPLIQLAETVSWLSGIAPVSAIASTDANIPLSLGIPAITLGGGGTGGCAHTVHEWYDNTNGARGVARAFAVLAALAVSN